MSECCDVCGKLDKVIAQNTEILQLMNGTKNIVSDTNSTVKSHTPKLQNIAMLAGEGVDIGKVIQGIVGGIQVVIDGIGAAIPALARSAEFQPVNAGLGSLGSSIQSLFPELQQIDSSLGSIGGGVNAAVNGIGQANAGIESALNGLDNANAGINGIKKDTGLIPTLLDTAKKILADTVLIPGIKITIDKNLSVTTNVQNIANQISSDLRAKALEDSLQRALSEITQLQTDLNQMGNAINNNIDNAETAINKSISSVDSNVSKIGSQVASVDTKVGTVQSSVNSLGSKIDGLSGEINALETSVGNIPSQTASQVQPSINSAKNELSQSINKIPTATTAVIPTVVNQSIQQSTASLPSTVSNAVNQNVSSTFNPAFDAINQQIAASNNAVTQSVSNVQNQLNSAVNAVNAIGQPATTSSVQQAINQALPSISNAASQGAQQGVNQSTSGQPIQNTNVNLDLSPVMNKLGAMEAQNALIVPGLIAGVTPALNQMLNNTSQSNLQNAAASGTCQTTKPGGCMSSLINGQTGQLGNMFNNALNGANLGLNGAQIAQLNRIESAVNTINNGVNGMQNFLNNFAKSIHLDKAINALNLYMNLHNAYMLSSGLSQTLLSATSNVLAVFGIKDEKGSPLDLNALVGNTLESVAVAALGTTTVDGIKSEWKAFNRIYQAGANILSSVHSIVYNLQDSANIIGSWIAQIGNGLRKDGVASENSWRWMNPTPNFKNPFFNAMERLENLEDATSQIDQIAGNVLSIQESATQIVTQKDALDRALSQADGTYQPPIPNEAVKTLNEFIDTKELSVSPAIDPSDEIKPEE